MILEVWLVLATSGMLAFPSGNTPLKTGASATPSFVSSAAGYFKTAPLDGMPIFVPDSTAFAMPIVKATGNFPMPILTPDSYPAFADGAHDFVAAPWDTLAGRLPRND